MLIRAGLSISLLTLTLTLAACGGATSTDRKPTAPPELNQRTLYVGVQDNNLYALNAATGAVRWHYETGGAVDSSPALVNGVIYVGSADNSVYALDAAGGKLVWKHETGDAVASSPAVA
jgi:outer membrane protein assembly factor BamB